MKKHLYTIKIVTLITAVFFAVSGIFFTARVDSLAASATAKLTGPSTARVGDTVTFVLKLNGNGIQGAEATLEYSNAQLEYMSMSKKIANPWMAELSGNRLVAYDNEFSSPINGEKDLIAVSFKVKSVSVGTEIRVSFKEIIVSDGMQDISAETASASFTVAPPLSSDNSLALLTVGNGTLSPAFSAGTYKYTVKVPHEVTKLDVKASASHGNAKVEINNPDLISEKTVDITIKVTAENGAVKTYTVSAYREKDLNYVPSGNCNLAGITATGYRLSPLFDGALTEYVIWVPYETEKIEIRAWAEHDKASASVIKADLLKVGDNEVKIKCTAENGKEKLYTITVKRAAAHQEVEATIKPTLVPTATPAPTETPAPTATPVPTETPAPTETFAITETLAPTATLAPADTDFADCTCRPSENIQENSGGREIGVIDMVICGIICGVAAAAVSALITALILKKKMER
ncbi:MAG: cadherin-like beta sandwich domain-containing protein [Clostridia bacterium]|nr:cadherin-like beta sandwich domain-containing protein [Clostridia bacterium]